MKTTEMKEILFQKLQDEGCYFTKSDISITTTKEGYKVVIKDYEHIPFTITTEEDTDYFGYIVYIRDEFEERNIIFVDSKKEYDFKTALVRLGYYIGTRF